MENSQRRKISAFRFIGLTGAIGVIVVGIAMGGRLATFIHIPSILFAGGMTFFMLLASFGKDFLKFIPDAILTLLSKSAGPCPRFAEIARFGGRYVIGAGLTGTLVGLVQMLANLSDPSNLGRGMAVALLTTLYAVIISEIFFAYLHRAYSEPSDAKEAVPVSYGNVGLAGGVVAFTLIAFLLLLISFASFS